MANDKDKPEGSIALDPRVYFAAERTLLAWVRTGLAMMGFGFVVARFGLFLREVAVLHGGTPKPHSGLSLWIGTTLIILGVVINVAATFKHCQAVRRLERGQPLRFAPWSLEMGLAVLLAVLGTFMALYFIIGLDH